MGLKSIYELNREFLTVGSGVKPLSELNREFAATQVSGESVQGLITPERFESGSVGEETDTVAEECGKKGAGRKGRRSILGVISDILFYLAIVAVVGAVVAAGPGDGGPKRFMGYSYFIVLTPSMQSEIPKGSLILVRETDPERLEEGDNITFLRDAGSTVTHKIVSIYEDYQGSGERGFETKGVSNANADRDIVIASNVVGRVILSVPVLGAILVALRANLFLLFFIFLLLVFLSFFLRALLSINRNISNHIIRRKNKRNFAFWRQKV